MSTNKLRKLKVSAGQDGFLLLGGDRGTKGNTQVWACGKADGNDQRQEAKFFHLPLDVEFSDLPLSP